MPIRTASLRSQFLCLALETLPLNLRMYLSNIKLIEFIEHTHFRNYIFLLILSTSLLPFLFFLLCVGFISCSRNDDNGNEI